MPSLFITAELIGASELHGVRRELSLESLLDSLDLAPSQSTTGIFCSWRLRLDVDSSVQPESRGMWKVERGQASGQTQVYDAEVSSVTQLHTFDAIWAHPIDLQLAWGQLPDVPVLPSFWPRLELQLMGIDSLQRTNPYGQASVVIPMTPGERLLELPIIAKRPSSLLGSLALALSLTSSSKDLDSSAREDHSAVMDFIGTLHIRVGVTMHGFEAVGIQCA